MLLWLAGSALAQTALVGTSMSQGGSPVRLELRPDGANAYALNLQFLEFEKTVAEERVVATWSCDEPAFAAVRDRVDGPCTGLWTQISDRHPVYDYLAKTKLRCVFGGPSSPAWCRLQYTGWFQLTPGAPPAREAVAIQAEAALREHVIARTAAGVPLPPERASVRYAQVEYAEDGPELVLGTPARADGPLSPGTHLVRPDDQGHPAWHLVVQPDGTLELVDQVDFDDQGRAVVRTHYLAGSLDQVIYLHRDRDQPAYLARGGPGRAVYLLRPLR